MRRRLSTLDAPWRQSPQLAATSLATLRRRLTTLDAPCRQSLRVAAASPTTQFNWMTRRRLLHWYAQLKALEAAFDASENHKHLLDKQAEIERIEGAVSKIHFPLNFSDQVYHLRSHIDIVRRKIASRIRSYRQVAAE